MKILLNSAIILGSLFAQAAACWTQEKENQDNFKGSECAGINRIGIENESILRRRFSQLLRPSAEGRMR